MEIIAIMGNIPLLGFASGVGVSLIAALVASLLAKEREKTKYLEERRFQIYMKLMELYASYFWFTVDEKHTRETRGDLTQKCFKLSWEIADLLRSADDIEFLEDIMDVILANKFTSAKERYEEMGRLLNKMGKLVNPRYAKKIREISMRPTQNFPNETVSNAPGAG